jgi:hypothetical protein
MSETHLEINSTLAPYFCGGVSFLSKAEVQKLLRAAPGIVSDDVINMLEYTIVTHGERLGSTGKDKESGVFRGHGEFREKMGDLPSDHFRRGDIVRINPNAMIQFHCIGIRDRIQGLLAQGERDVLRFDVDKDCCRIRCPQYSFDEAGELVLSGYLVDMCDWEGRDVDASPFTVSPEDVTRGTLQRLDVNEFPQDTVEAARLLIYHARKAFESKPEVCSRVISAGKLISRHFRFLSPDDLYEDYPIEVSMWPSCPDRVALLGCTFSLRNPRSLDEPEILILKSFLKLIGPDPSVSQDGGGPQGRGL